MNRYFLEVRYRGTNYAGFQVQKNANSIQAEVEKALQVYFRTPILLTGSSRTDAGVHALQNFFHFDSPQKITSQVLYNLNSILPPDIAVTSIHEVPDDAHCRFDAIAREYRYFIYSFKDPFLVDQAYYYPYTLHFENLNLAAAMIKGEHDFTSFSKRNTQVKTFTCTILYSSWEVADGILTYKIKANRFLRGMVRGLVGTMLLIGRNNVQPASIMEILAARDCSLANFSVPGKGLWLYNVEFPAGLTGSGDGLESKF